MNKERLDFHALEKSVISRGLCTSCGTCVGVCPLGLIDIRWVEGDAEPYLIGSPCPECGICVKVCPGVDIPILQLEQIVFGRKRNPNKDALGIYEKCFAAYARDRNIRKGGASGGVATAILSFALEKGMVDAVIVAGFNKKMPWRAEGKLVTKSKELLKYARSKYGGNPPLNALLSRAVVDMGISKLGLIGCPCHIHGIRKIQSLGPHNKIAASIKFSLGLFCGTQFYFEGTRHLLREACGVDSLKDVAMIDYRWGDWPGRFYVKTKSGREVLVDRHEYVYHRFALAWQRDRCIVCMDHTSELADIAFGDYWSSERKPGDLGWNMVIARSKLGLQIMEQAEVERYIFKQEINIGEPSMAELKKHRAPFMIKRRQRYGIPVPNYGFVLSYDPGEQKPIHRAPSFDEAVVELPSNSRS